MMVVQHLNHWSTVKNFVYLLSDHARLYQSLSNGMFIYTNIYCYQTVLIISCSSVYVPRNKALIKMYNMQKNILTNIVSAFKL